MCGRFIRCTRAMADKNCMEPSRLKSQRNFTNKQTNQTNKRATSFVSKCNIPPINFLFRPLNINFAWVEIGEKLASEFCIICGQVRIESRH